MVPRWLLEARELAWWTHCNIGQTDLYRARQEAFGRLRRALIGVTAPADEDLANVFAAARWLASCSDSNRMGAPYYERKAAMATLRGCLAGYDRAREDAGSALAVAAVA
jgi:hypothetical protein